MKKILNAILILIAMLAVILASVYACTDMALHSICGNEIMEEVMSPDKKLKAVIFIRDCGATTGYSTQLSVIEIANQPGDETGNTLILSDKFHSHLRFNNGGAKVKAVWTSDDSLTIFFDKKIESIKQEDKIKGIRITYEQLSDGNVYEDDVEFETIDKDSNKINLTISIRYRMEGRKLNRTVPPKYGKRYSDSLFLPVISSVSGRVLKSYSAGEVYNYRRDEIAQILKEQTKIAFARDNIELTDFFIRSVKLPDAVMRRFEKEHVVRYQNAMNKCRRETKGVITKMDNQRQGGSIVFYEFVIENKHYTGILEPATSTEKVSVGDSLTIEYACEDVKFYRVKK